MKDFVTKVLAKYGLELVTDENEMMHALKPGMRIELMEMDDPYGAIEPGTKGTVEHVNRISQKQAQVKVKWDNGRGLMLALPEDKVKILEAG